MKGKGKVLKVAFAHDDISRDQTRLHHAPQRLSTPPRLRLAQSLTRAINLLIQLILVFTPSPSLSCLLTTTTPIPTQAMPNSPPTAPVLYSFPTDTELVNGLATFILKAQKESIDKNGRFTVALSGGTLPKHLSALVNHPGVKWDKWYASTSLISPFFFYVFNRIRRTHVLLLPAAVYSTPEHA